MLLEGVTLDEFAGEGGEKTPSPKAKKPGEKRKREGDKEDKEEEKEKEKGKEKRVRRGGVRWQRGGRHVENVSVTTTMQFSGYTTIIFTFIFNTDFKQEHNNSE